MNTDSQNNVSDLHVNDQAADLKPDFFFAVNSALRCLLKAWFQDSKKHFRISQFAMLASPFLKYVLMRTPFLAGALVTPVSGLWLIGMSAAFLKSTLSIDRKLQGRILEAIAHISQDPITPKGDTIQPLKGNYKGSWRYRIGDHRVIYEPDPTTKRIIIKGFDNRGDAYD